MPFPQLPPGFRFGTATAAYSVEGAVAEDGRGPSIWDAYCGLPGRIADGTSGEVAADHYHRYAEDLALLRRLGTTGYQFSLSWPRIQPDGRGRPNPKGLDHYDRVIDCVLDAGQEPIVALYHFDLPQALEDDGGWLNRRTIDAFGEYAALVGERFSDRVAHWIPVHEPNAVAFNGYAIGNLAPGRKLLFEAVVAAHHVLVAHGRAVTALRAAGARSVGCANNHAPMWPASDDAADVGATKLFDSLWNGLMVEPMLLGRYPTDLEPLLEDVHREGDLATIRQPLDLYGITFYNPLRVAAAPPQADLPFEFRAVRGHPFTGEGRPVVPSALREWLILLRARFRAALPPLVLTGTGAAYDDAPGVDGVVDDQARIAYLAGHLEAVADACRRGVDVRGFYVWSLLDSFEWSLGYTQRFGLVHVDRGTLARTPKRSFQWYADAIAAQGIDV